MRILLLLLFAGLACCYPSFAQQRSPLVQDSVRKDSARIAIEKMPKTAAIRSAILPGLGQVYNKRWWKVPIVYAGFISVGLVYEFNQRYYKEFLGEVQYRLENNNEPKNPIYAGYSYEGMVRIKDNYRRNRDLSILGFVGMHALNILDAYIDAKFFRFDISDDLSMQVHPSFYNQPYLTQAYMVKFKLAL